MSQNLLQDSNIRSRRDVAIARPARAEAEAVLRDIAYVLQLTRRVRAEILNNQDEMELATVS